MKLLTEAMVFWDQTDHMNEGWAYRAKFHDGHEETGEFDGSIRETDFYTDMAEAVDSVAFRFGFDVNTDHVQVDKSGLTGSWSLTEGGQ